MSRRANLDIRCVGCMMHPHLCFCALVPTIETRSKLVLLVHYREARKPTNSGQLAARILAGSRVEIIGDRPKPEILVDDRTVVLYPGGEPLTPADAPATVIVPDGNWRQAAKMARRYPGLERVRKVSFIDPRPTEYRLRSEPQPVGLATFEAIARAWKILEGDAIEEQMMKIFRIMVTRTLHLRGTIGADEVAG